MNPNLTTEASSISPTDEPESRPFSGNKIVKIIEQNATKKVAVCA
jgi:hypothetical protein